MSLFDALGAIGGGLRVAGGTLSPDVYQANAQQDENQKTRDEQKKRFLAELLHKHFSEGTLSPEGYQSGMAKLGFQTPPMQQAPDYGGIAGEITSKVDSGGYLGGGSSGGLGGGGGLTDPASGASIKQQPQDTITGQQSPNTDLIAKTVEVPANKVSVYSTEEINKATAEFASRVASQPGSTKDKAKAIKDFRDNLKSERKSLLDEQNKESEIKNRNSEIAAREREKDPAFVKELKYFQNMKPEDPGYQFMLDRLTLDANGKKTAARKNIEADLEAQGLKSGTESYDEEFHRRMGAYLTKQSTSKAATGPQDLGDGLGPMAWDALLFGKNPPGMGNASAEQRRQVAKERGRIGHALGLSDVEISMLPQDNKVKMKAVDKLTTWGAFVDKSSEQLEKTIDIAISYAKKIGPGKLQALNKAIISGEKQFNDPDANAYALQVNSIRLEYGRLMAGPTSNAMLPVEAMKKGDDLISTGFDMSSWYEIKKAVHRDAAVTSNSVKNQRNALMGSIKNPGQKDSLQAVDMPSGQGNDTPLHAPEVRPANNLEWTDDDEKRLQELEKKHGNK